MSTYHQEMKQKYPDRPYMARPTWELENIKRALSSLTLLNTEEEDKRLVNVAEELKMRRRD